jgi:hypothetical protein
MSAALYLPPSLKEGNVGTKMAAIATMSKTRKGAIL